MMWAPEPPRGRTRYRFWLRQEDLGLSSKHTQKSVPEQLWLIDAEHGRLYVIVVSCIVWSPCAWRPGAGSCSMSREYSTAVLNLTMRLMGFLYDKTSSARHDREGQDGCVLDALKKSAAAAAAQRHSEEQRRNFRSRSWKIGLEQLTLTA